MSEAGNPRAAARRGLHVRKQSPHELRAAGRARRYRQILAVTGVVWCAALALDQTQSRGVELASAQALLTDHTIAAHQPAPPLVPGISRSVAEVRAITSGQATTGARVSTSEVSGSAFQLAAASCPGLSWTVLAAIAEVETGGGRPSPPSAYGALGPMQLLPATWRAYRTGPWAKITDLQDAATAAARLLCADGAPVHLRAALWSYNHSPYYVERVLGALAGMQRGRTLPH